ncbi:MAG TPA: NAD-dependent malic enzyme [Candidatus Limnocylindrales bacterium]|nr:NAD-dependent malic enzyme [Candidatus Limnocylindrales bacterium]
MATSLRGHDLIAQPLINKGTAFTEDERTVFGLRGLLPAAVATIEDQVALELEHVRRKTDELERYIGLAALQDRNETLFYRLLVDNLDEFLPTVYTPTVGLACQQFSHIFRRPRGVWIAPDDVDRVDEILDASGVDARLIVVTDNERILGLGDQGAGGMAIPVGKLVLYSAAAGIHPAATLPVSLDVGTDRQELLDDPLYVGYRAPRLRGTAYDAVVEAFVAGVERVFPRALIQWEDFKQHNAIRILERYRGRVASFNDDIQGTGAVVLAGLLAARRERGGLLADRFLLMGAGAAAIGIARTIVLELSARGEDPDAARSRIALLDRRGLIHRGRTDLADDQWPYAVDACFAVDVAIDVSDPVAVARAHGATVLIGATGCGGAFSEALVREVASNDAAPIILPLSNPTACAEATPADILDWTDGRALVATGSPNRMVEGPAGLRSIGQANNVFIFPGVGLGTIVSGADEVSDETFRIAAHRLAACVPTDRLQAGALYPAISDLRSVAREVAITVAGSRLASGTIGGPSDLTVEDAIDRAMWWPEYQPLTAGG